MMRINGSYLFELGAKIHPLVEIPTAENARVGDVFYPLFIAETAVTQLLQYRSFGLRTCLDEGSKLLNVIKAVRQKIEHKGANDIVEFHDTWSIKQQAQNFETVLKAELAIADLYYVLPKGSHETIRLIEDGRHSFSDDLTDKVPDAVFDVQEATRCLAFERFTSCGFHLHRANEAVLRKYWDVVTRGAARPKQESMGAYLGEMKRRKKGSAKVRNILGEIKDMHRNPIIHPEHTLDQKQALALMGVINASMTYMLEAIPSPLAPPASGGAP